VWVCLCLGLVASAFPSANVWGIGHIAAAIVAVACFAAAACGGVVYLHAHRRLRLKPADMMVSRWPSLERLDRFNRRALSAGFALLTASIAAGLYDALMPLEGRWFRNWPTHPKTLAAVAAWCVGAAAVYAAYAKRFRGRRTAMLSIAAFVLVFCVMLASVLMPKS
jgi:ABC-type uncharacterized transport system permease subunit